MSRNLQPLIDHFTVVFFVAWPLNEGEAGGDLVLRPPCFSYVHDAVFMLISRNFPKKSNGFSSKVRSPLASLSFKGQATKHATVK